MGDVREQGVTLPARRLVSSDAASRALRDVLVNRTASETTAAAVER
jgi:hypothetical protein